jgi:hypothetical protein
VTRVTLRGPLSLENAADPSQIATSKRIVANPIVREFRGCMTRMDSKLSNPFPILFIAGALRRHLDLFASGKKFVSGGRVSQHQDIFRFFVFVEIVNPFLLQQPADKVVVTFPVLNAVFPRRVASLQFQFDIAEAAILENLLGDIDDTLVLEHPAILRLCQKPEPGDNRHAVDEVTAMNGSAIETLWRNRGSNVSCRSRR